MSAYHLRCALAEISCLSRALARNAESPHPTDFRQRLSLRAQLNRALRFAWRQATVINDLRVNCLLIGIERLAKEVEKLTQHFTRDGAVWALLAQMRAKIIECRRLLKEYALRTPAGAA